jgi:CHAT domain-containing protein/predicted negative regulator of RcsB-dependent stress response
LAFLVICAATAATPGTAQDEGVVVVSVAPGLAADQAGLRPGDRLVGWSQGPAARGAFSAPRDVMQVESERGPRGPVAVAGWRGDAPLAFSLFPDEWGLAAKPVEPRAASPEAGAWALFEQAEALRNRGQFAEAAVAYGQAIRLQEIADPEGLGLARMIEGSGVVAYALLRDLPQARSRLERALRILEKEAPRSLAHARTLQAFAQTLSSTVEARKVLGRATELAQELAPESLTHASVLYAQAWATPTADQLTLAQHALAIRERLAPESVATAQSQRLVGLSLGTFGRLEEARAHYLRAVALLERVEPLGSTMAGVLDSLGSLASERGELGEAEALLRRSLEIREKAGSGSKTANTLQNLAGVLVLRRELDQAERHLERARTILEEQLPDTEYLAYCFRGLGDLAMERRDAAAAEVYFRRALEIFKKINPNGFARATTEHHLGGALALAGRFDEAQAAYLEALGLVGDVVDVQATEMQHDLGALSLRRNDLDAAEKWFDAALAARTKLSPGSIWEALSAHSRGLVARRRGQKDAALGFLRQAVEALESQSRRLGGSAEAAVAFRAHFEELYRDLEELLIETGNREEAFAVLERARARALLALLTQRDVKFTEVPAPLERERREADSEHDALFEELALSADDSKRRDLLRKIEEALHRQDDVRARIRASAPRLAALRDPQTLDLPGVRRVLESGTLLVAYSLGPKQGRVYTVGPGPDDFAVHDLGAGGPEIRRSVEEFRRAIRKRRGVLRGALDAQSRALSLLLLGPIARQLPAARRILVVPDGVLHELPFSALRNPVDPSRYLIEQTPLHVVSSVSLYAQLVGPGNQRTASRVVGFGDPAFAAPAVSGGKDATATRAVQLGLRFGPLPAARRELEALRSLAPDEASIWLGALATEERVKAVGRDARILHFATHGFTDEEFPLESGLALSTPDPQNRGRDNGILQAWEIFESLRLDTSLVTLSACQTGLGKELAGEGLLGLTWAFQYAGARSVLASLWEVNDSSTAELMRRFYRHLGRGVSKAEALRLAQVELLRRPPTSAPYFWAAFQLMGEE